MPNHCANRFSIEGTPEELRAFLEKHVTTVECEDYQGNKRKDAQGVVITQDIFDFNTIIPMPESLEGTTSPTRDESHLERIRSAEHYESEEDREKDVQECIEQIELAKINKKKYGCDNWYDFKIQNWGTKWGAYDLEVIDDDVNDGFLTLEFNTAWSPGIPIHNKLAEMYPSMSFDLNCLDEGMGFGLEYRWVSGELVLESDRTGNSLYEFANDAFGYDYRPCEKCGEWADSGQCWQCEENEENEETD